MTLNQLIYFCAVYQYHSITRASKELYVSQPTISASLKSLEEEFHLSLFHHKKNSITPTAEGERFYKKAEKLIRRYEDFYSEFSSQSKAPFTIRLGIPPVMSTIFFPDFMLRYREQSDVPLTLHEARSARSCRLVDAEELDAAIVNLDLCDTERFHHHVILKDRFVYCVSKENPLSKEKELSFERLLKEPTILFNSDATQNSLVMARFASLKEVPNIVVHSSQLFTVLNFIRENLAGAFLYKSTPVDDPDIVKIPVTPAITSEIGLIWKKGIYINRNMNRFLDFVKSYHVKTPAQSAPRHPE